MMKNTWNFTCIYPVSWCLDTGITFSEAHHYVEPLWFMCCTFQISCARFIWLSVVFSVLYCGHIEIVCLVTLYATRCVYYTPVKRPLACSNQCTALVICKGYICQHYMNRMSWWFEGNIGKYTGWGSVMAW